MAAARIRGLGLLMMLTWGLRVARFTPGFMLAPASQAGMRLCLLLRAEEKRLSEPFRDRILSQHHGFHRPLAAIQRIRTCQLPIVPERTL